MTDNDIEAAYNAASERQIRRFARGCFIYSAWAVLLMAVAYLADGWLP